MWVVVRALALIWDGGLEGAYHIKNDQLHKSGP